MSNTCAICGKHTAVGHTVSKANNRTRRTFRPNLQRVRVRANGMARRLRICAACLKADKVQKA